MVDLKRQAEFIQLHTLTKQDLRKMILEKLERATAYYKANQKREIAQGQSQIAKCEYTGNEVLTADYKQAVNGRTRGWITLL